LEKYLFHLLGSNRTLPKAEVLAVFEALDIDFIVLHSYDQVLVVEASSIAGVAERLALCHGIYEFLGECAPDLREITDLARKVSRLLTPPVAVRVRRIRGRWRDLRRDVLEKEIGTSLGLDVDLSAPESLIVGFLADRFVLGRKLPLAVPREEYSRRHPKTRPFFHPGVLLPKIARAAVNLTRIKGGKKLLDPFCGTGGFLIEAGLIGAKVYGCDINSEMVKGCRKNLEHYGIRDFHLEVGDARQLLDKYPNSFDAIATDPPYGISASTGGLSLDKLYKEAFSSFYGVLKKGGFACVLSPEKIETEKYAVDSGFTIVETHFDRVHAALTRKILVIRK